MSSPQYRLIYWPVAGRGEFVRLIFEFAAVPYVEDNEPLKNGFAMGVAGPDVRPKDKDGFPLYAPPALEEVGTGLMLTQTPVICAYLGEKFGLLPERKEDVPRAAAVNATVHDFIGEGRLSFHGKNFYESYYKQQEETQPYIDYFVEKRLPRFLGYFETLLEWSAAKGWAFSFGNKVSYVDLALLHVLRAAASQFPEAWAQLSSKHPQLTAFKDQLEKEPKLVAYFASERCRPFEGNSMV